MKTAPAQNKEMLSRERMCTTQFFDHAAGPRTNTEQNEYIIFIIVYWPFSLFFTFFFFRWELI